MDEYQLELLMKYLQKHFNDDEIEELLNSDHPLTGFGKNGEISIRRMLGEIDIEYFCKAYTDQFNQEFGDYAKEILCTLKNGIESNAQENIAVVAPREHGKSSLSSLATPTWSAVYQKKNFVLFISANYDTAANFLTKIQRTLESPPITEDFGKMRDKKKTWNAEKIETSNGVWIACSGWKSGLRGLNLDTRPDLIILDDLEDKQTIESESLQKKLESAFKDEIGRLGYYKTDFFYIGTLLAEDSLLAKVMNEPSWKKLFYQCVTSFPKNEHLWDEWRVIYRDLENPNRLDDAYQYYLDRKEEMLEGSSVLWEGRFPEGEMKYKGAYYNVMLNREKWGESSFWKEDQNQPRSSASFLFQDLMYWDKLPSFDDMDLTLGLDPSMGKKNSDYQALCCMGRHKQTGRKYIIDSQLLKIKPKQLLDVILEWCEKYPITKIGAESTAFQEYLADDLKQKLKENEMYQVILKKIKPRKNKESRIENLEPFISRGEILFNKDCVTFNTHCKNWSRSGKEKDDGIDCVQLTFELAEKSNRKARVIEKPNIL